MTFPMVFMALAAKSSGFSPAEAAVEATVLVAAAVSVIGAAKPKGGAAGTGYTLNGLVTGFDALIRSSETLVDGVCGLLHALSGLLHGLSGLLHALSGAAAAA